LRGSDVCRDEHVVVIRPSIARIQERAMFLVREKYVEEHITVYNRRYPREFWWVTLKLVCGGAASEFSAVTHKRAFAFSCLESTICKFLARFSSFWAQFRRDVFCSGGGGERGENKSESRRSRQMAIWAAQVGLASESPEYDIVLFEMHYATDELIHFMLKSVSQSGLQLASMYYGYVFRHDVFSTFLLPEGQDLVVPELVYSWVGQLGHFLSFFPDKRDRFRNLTELEDRFRDRIAASAPRPPP
jgi:hypothetical protein